MSTFNSIYLFNWCDINFYSIFISLETYHHELFGNTNGRDQNILYAVTYFSTRNTYGNITKLT